MTICNSCPCFVDIEPWCQLGNFQIRYDFDDDKYSPSWKTPCPMVKIEKTDGTVYVPEVQDGDM